MRSFSPDLPLSMSQVHFTSWRSGKVSSVPSSFQAQLVARSGTIDFGLFCGTFWSYMTKLLNTAIIGRFTALVDSSRSEILAGLSKWPMVSMPPCFWVKAGGAAANASKNGTAAANPQRLRFIPRYLLFSHGLKTRHSILAGPFAELSCRMEHP